MMLVGSYETRVGERGLRVLLADLQEHLTPTKLAEQLYSQSRNELTVVDLLIIRPPVDEPMAEVATLASKMQAVFERVAKLPVHLLTSQDFQHQLSANIHPGVDEVLTEYERGTLISALRQAELADIARRTRAILRADGPTIFRAPSKTYCQRFFRAGNVQMHRGTLDVFFFWMLPWLKDCHAIVADTWTISSIALNTARLLARYAPVQGRCKVDMLAEYLDGSPEVEAATDAVLERVSHNCEGTTLALFSACMTGNAVARLTSATQRHAHEALNFEFLSLYNLEPDLPVACLCELFRAASAGAFQHQDELPAPVDEMRIIDIDRTTYFPSVIVENTVPVNEVAARPARQFFQDYLGCGAFFVHRNSYVATQKFRHHAIYPDLSVLLRHELFQTRLREKLATLDRPPSLIVTPLHDAGLRMAEFSATYLESLHGSRVAIFAHLDLNLGRNVSAEEDSLRSSLQAMNEAGAILVLDDVSVTGGRLTRYQKSLRDLNFRGQIHYLVGLARPNRMSAWERRTRDLRYRAGNTLKHTLGHVEFLLLPDWDEQHCPWCLEQSLYRRLVLECDELPAQFARRSAELEQTHADRGEFSALFLHQGEEAALRLTKNSIFVGQDASHAEIFAAVASALQQLRTHENPILNLARQHYPQLNCLDPVDYLGNTFSDPVLRAAILRAAHRAELVRVRGEDELGRGDAMKGILLNGNPDEHCIGMELLLASSLGKLPLITFSAKEKLILQEYGIDGAVDVLLPPG